MRCYKATTNAECSRTCSSSTNVVCSGTCSSSSFQHAVYLLRYKILVLRGFTLQITYLGTIISHASTHLSTIITHASTHLSTVISHVIRTWIILTYLILKLGYRVLVLKGALAKHTTKHTQNLHTAQIMCAAAHLHGSVVSPHIEVVSVWCMRDYEVFHISSQDDASLYVMSHHTISNAARGPQAACK